MEPLAFSLLASWALAAMVIASLNRDETPSLGEVDCKNDLSKFFRSNLFQKLLDHAVRRKFYTAKDSLMRFKADK